MAKIIDDETMENVCILAKLSLSEEEKEKAKAEMQKMLDFQSGKSLHGTIFPVFPAGFFHSNL